MPFLSPPSHGLLGLLTGHDDFLFHVKAISIHTLARLGLFPVFDDTRLKETQVIWRECYAQWKTPDDPPETVSHIKMAGALLWAFIHDDALPASEVVKLNSNQAAELESYGATDRVVNFQMGKGEIFQASPNPALGYTFVTSVFNTIQRARNMTRQGIDFDNPPLTHHYFHNLACWYMVDCDPKPNDLYMIYKTMDLYALNHPPRS